MRILLFMSLLVCSFSLKAEEYPVLDGRKYNGLFYPNVDILEWGDPMQLEFQVYDKKNPLSVTGKTLKIGDNTVFVFTIDFPERGERICRRVLAPKDFDPEKPVYLTTETHDIERNNFIFSHKPIAGKTSKVVAGVDDCIEVKPHSPVAKNRVPEIEKPPAFVIEDPQENKPVQRVPASRPKMSEVVLKNEFQKKPVSPSKPKQQLEIDKTDIYESGLGPLRD